MNSVRIGTRRSSLAMYQTNLIAKMLGEHYPQCDIEIVKIDTKGDKILDKPLPEIGGKGLFTFEIEQGLLDESIDLAVHSLKDLPSDLPEGLIFAGATSRGTPTDCFVSTKHKSLNDVPDGATIATGSVRRRAQLMRKLPNVNFVDLRGNIETRLKKLETNGWDGIIMATTALERLEMTDRITERLGPDGFVPAVGQGAIAIEIKEGRQDIIDLLKPLIDPITQQAVEAERHFMRHLEGGCSAPLAAHARLDGEQWTFWAYVSNVAATDALLFKEQGPDPKELAQQALDRFIHDGARELLRAES